MGTTLISMVNLGRRITRYRKVLTNDEADIFLLPDNLSGSTDYNPNTVLDEDEWFKIDNFSSKSYCLPLLKQETISSVNIDAIERADFGKFIFLCGYQGDYYFFQRVTSARQVNQKGIFYFGDLWKYMENIPSISLNKYADAIYHPVEDKLFFRKLNDITVIFDGIEELHREATENEVTNFLNSNFIELSEGFTSSNVKTNNRKRIAIAIETLNRFSNKEKKKIFEYIKDYCPELANSNNKFTVHNEDSLKKLLYGIEERYYTTPVGEEQRIANSIISMNKGVQL